MTYEYECPDHGVFEVSMPMAERKSSIDCPVCHFDIPRIVSQVLMKPDGMWAGHMVEGYGYITSQRKLEKIKRDKGIIQLTSLNDYDDMKKLARRGREEWDQKIEKQIHQQTVKALANTGLLTSD